MLHKYPKARVYASGRFRGVPSRLHPPWTEVVTHGSVSECWNLDRSTVQHGTQNIQNDFHQWLSDSFGVHQIRFRPGLCRGPHWGSLQCSTRPPSWFKGPYFWGTGEGRKMERGGKGERKGTGGPAPFHKFLELPLYAYGVRKLEAF